MNKLRPTTRPGAGAVRRSVPGVALILALGNVAVTQAAEYDQVIVFGDSISDSGNYATKAPVGAGKFTTNPDDVWVEIVAKGLGLDLKPHAVGGSNYAEGGARVALQRPDAPGNLTRRPVTEQVADFMTNDGKLTRNSLVIIQGGGNDVFSTKFNGPTDTPADLEVLRVAAEGLADQIDHLIKAGAGTVVTTSVPKFDQYNERYDAALASRGLNVLYIDMAGLIAEIETAPAEFGITNTTSRACRGFALESFTCLPKDYVEANANRTYLYADGVHFTGVVHEIEGDATLAMMRAPLQIAQLPHMLLTTNRATGQLARERMDAASRNPVPGWRLIGGTQLVDGDATGQGKADGTILQAGFERGFNPALTAGSYLSWHHGNGDFVDDRGALSVDSYSLQGFATLQHGRIAADFTAAIGRANLSDIERKVMLGPTLRIEQGGTDSDFLTVETRIGVDALPGPLRIAPFLSMRYDRISVDGYAERGDRSTQATYAGQKLETLEMAVGVRLSSDEAWRGIIPALEIGYAGDVLNHTQKVAILPHGAPVWYTSQPVSASDDALFYGLTATIPVTTQTAVNLGVRGRSAGKGQNSLSGGISLSLGF